MLNLKDRKMYWNELCLVSMKSITETEDSIIITKPDLTTETIVKIDINPQWIEILKSYAEQYKNNPETFGVV